MAFLQVYCNGELKFKHPLNSIATRIGRAADNDVVIDNAGVSSHHALIVQEEGAFIVEDTGSTNGVFVNGRRVSRKLLQYGDEIGIFKHILKFTAVDLPVASGTGAIQSAPAISQDQTVMVDLAQLNTLLKERQAQNAYLLQTAGAGQGRKLLLSKQRYDIGKSADCDIRAGGWFAPQLAAKIIRQSSGYFLFPEKRGKVRINGNPINVPVKLQQRDNIEVRGVALTFYESAS